MRKNLAENLDVREVYDIMTQALNQAGLRWFCPDCRHIDFGAHSLDKCPKCGNTSWEFYKWMD